MSIKNHITFLGFALLVSLVFFLISTYSFQPNFERVFKGIMLFAQVSGLYLLLRTGTAIKKKRNLITMCVLVFIALIGALFKLQHWPGAGILIFFPLIGIAILYSLNFFLKAERQVLDFWKILWVLSFTGYLLAHFFHQFNTPFMYEIRPWWALFTHLLFWLAILHTSIVHLLSLKKVDEIDFE